MPAPNFALLAEEAFAWVAQRAQLTPPPRYVDPADKFIIRSALQKAVRRGRAEAVELALALHRIGPGYAWRGILTIALEDVGFGSPDAVLWATAAQTVGFRRQVGEVPLLIALVRDMALNLKTRAACELSFIVDTGEPDAFRYIGRLTTKQLLGLVEAPDPYETYIALGVLRGVTPAGQRVRQHDPNGVLGACEIIHDQLPPGLARAASTVLVCPLDNMAIASFPAWRAAQAEGSAEVVDDEFPESRRLAGYASEAYDQHERLGRAAIRLFARCLSNEHAAVRELSEFKAGTLIGDAVFLVEGQCLDRWANGGTLTRLRSECDGYSLMRHGVSGGQAQAVREIVSQSIPRLNDCRAEVISKARFGG